MTPGTFVYTDAFLEYDFDPHHPMQPARLQRTYELLQRYGVLERVTVKPPRDCPIECLQRVHTKDFLNAIQRASNGEDPSQFFRYGLGTSDTPIFANLWRASLRYAGASFDAADDVAEGRCDVAMNIAGGLHHAHRDKAAGFCVLNDCAVAINRLRKRYDRVAYVDLDAHHGDGVQEIYYTDPSVLTISIHEAGYTLYPGSGDLHETGEGAGMGYSINIPLTEGTGDQVWHWAFQEVAMPLLRAFNPGAICLQLGTDPHYLDPLAHLLLTAQGWLDAVRDVKSLGKPIVALGGGGYSGMTVPRMWALAFGVLFDIDLPDETPADFTVHHDMPWLTDHSQPEIRSAQDKISHHEAFLVVEQLRHLLYPRLGSLNAS